MGHLKHDDRLQRNWLKGSGGDIINPLMAACAWNLKKWLIAFFWLAKSTGFGWLYGVLGDETTSVVLWGIFFTKSDPYSEKP